MIAVDTNLLIYAHREESSWHAAAFDCIAGLAAGRVSGPQVHDARVAAICRQHGVRELWTADRDVPAIPIQRGRRCILSMVR